MESLMKLIFNLDAAVKHGESNLLIISPADLKVLKEVLERLIRRLAKLQHPSA